MERVAKVMRVLELRRTIRSTKKRTERQKLILTCDKLFRQIL